MDYDQMREGHGRVSGFRRRVNEICALLGCYAEYLIVIDVSRKPVHPSHFQRWSKPWIKILRCLTYQRSEDLNMEGSGSGIVKGAGRRWMRDRSRSWKPDSEPKTETAKFSVRIRTVALTAVGNDGFLRHPPHIAILHLPIVLCYVMCPWNKHE